MHRVCLFALTLLPLVGCQGPKAVSATPPTNHASDLTAKGGRWEAESKKVVTEWTFRPDGSYDALHQEGNVAAQIRGKYHWEKDTLVVEPTTVEARSIKKAEAASVEAKLKPVQRIDTNWSGADKFTVNLTSTDPITFSRF